MTVLDRTIEHFRQQAISNESRQKMRFFTYADEVFGIIQLKHNHGIDMERFLEYIGTVYKQWQSSVPTKECARQIHDIIGEDSIMIDLDR